MPLLAAGGGIAVPAGTQRRGQAARRERRPILRTVRVRATESGRDTPIPPYLRLDLPRLAVVVVVVVVMRMLMVLAVLAPELVVAARVFGRAGAAGRPSFVTRSFFTRRLRHTAGPTRQPI